MTFDVAVIGAGIAGLTCAQQLHQAGYAVIVLEKSRGPGGRVATRRLANTWADHGTCYLSPQPGAFGQWLEALVAQGVLQVWTEQLHHLSAEGELLPLATAPRYASPTGLTAIAKSLAAGLTIEFSQRVVNLQPTATTWQLTCEPIGEKSPLMVAAKAVVVAIPAPQALALVLPEWDEDLCDRLRAVEFAPCLSAIAVYSSERQPAATALNWQGVRVHQSAVTWIGLDSSKQIQPPRPVLIVQSTAEFATQNLATSDLVPIGQQLIQIASQLAPWFSQPDLLQVQRWRYAFPLTPRSELCLTAATTLPLLCAGDWCGGDRVENAWHSGQATAQKLIAQLNDR